MKLASLPRASKAAAFLCASSGKQLMKSKSCWLLAEAAWRSAKALKVFKSKINADKLWQTYIPYYTVRIGQVSHRLKGVEMYTLTPGMCLSCASDVLHISIFLMYVVRICSALWEACRAMSGCGVSSVKAWTRRHWGQGTKGSGWRSLTSWSRKTWKTRRHAQTFKYFNILYTLESYSQEVHEPSSALLSWSLQFWFDCHTVRPIYDAQAAVILEAMDKAIPWADVHSKLQFGAVLQLFLFIFSGKDGTFRRWRYQGHVASDWILCNVRSRVWNFAVWSVSIVSIVNFNFSGAALQIFTGAHRCSAERTCCAAAAAAIVSQLIFRGQLWADRKMHWQLTLVTLVTLVTLDSNIL